MNELLVSLQALVGEANVRAWPDIHDDDTHDEAVAGVPVVPLAVVRPASTDEVSQVLAIADAHRLPVVARGSGTGLSGGARPCPDGIVIAFDRMSRILEIDEQNHVAVVQPGVTLAQLDEALAPLGFVYPVYPGEMTASIGGNVSTNAGGMRAVRYGVTRHHVLGLEMVLASGEVLRTGGKFVKSSSGYDLTQLLVGSEGTLALVTEATLKLSPRLPHRATLLAPFAAIDEIARVVPPLLRTGLAPLMLEYIDALSMGGITQAAGLDLGIPEGVRTKTAAYLVVVLESTHAARLEADVDAVAQLVADLGAFDVYVLPPTSGAALIAARERAFHVAKALGVNDIIDTVVPRATIPRFLAEATRLATRHGALVTGCGHVGDGNVHFSVFQPDAARRTSFLEAMFAAAVEMGGAISGEHGIGIDKQRYFLTLETPAKLALMRRIKAAFDPHGILGPGRLLDKPAESVDGETGR
jgi:glycolate oxidase